MYPYIRQVLLTCRYSFIHLPTHRINRIYFQNTVFCQFNEIIIKNANAINAYWVIARHNQRGPAPGSPYSQSHNAPVSYPTMHHKEHKCAHFCSEWCIVGYVTGALHCNLSPTKSTTKAYSNTINWTDLNQCMATHHDNGQKDGRINIKAAKATKDDPQGKPSSVHKGTANEGEGTIVHKIENTNKNKTKKLWQIT